jgi:hypothetical protein
VPIKVERAQLVTVPRAEVVGTGQTIDESWLTNPANISKWVTANIPGERNIWVRYRGEIPDVNSLPTNAQRGDWYHTPEGISWIYMVPAATGRLG